MFVDTGKSIVILINGLGFGSIDIHSIECNSVHYLAVRGSSTVAGYEC